MRLFKILEAMTAHKVDYCFQHQAKYNYYNISLKDTKGRSHELTCKNIKDAEVFLDVMWGHLLTPLLPMPSKLPLPSFK